MVLRVAIVGCGAVVETYHLPVLAGHDEFEVTALVDNNPERANVLAEPYGVAKTFGDFNSLTRDDADAVVIASPPFHHAPCALALLKKGFDLFIEKPIAINVAQASEICSVAESCQRVVSVGVFRRLLPNLGMLKQAIAQEVLGPVKSVNVTGAATYSWGAATLANMRRETAGGGVLMDMGPHYFDQLLYLLGNDVELLSYADDAMGGVEADCLAEFRWTVNSRPVKVSALLSRTRDLCNEFRVECELGDFVLPPSSRYEVLVAPKEASSIFPLSSDGGNGELVWRYTGDTPKPWHASFRAQFDDWLEAIKKRSQPQLSAESSLKVMQLVEECYNKRTPQTASWENHPLLNEAAGSSSIEATDAERTRISVTTPQTVLITGASGFIGCRAAEILSQRPEFRVVAALRSPSNASRIARLDVELRQADLRSRDEVSQLMEGCDSVIHCAVGTDSWDSKSVRDVTVNGTKNLVREAESHGLRSLIHVSSIAVHSDELRGTIDSATTVSPDASTYAKTKAAAEEIVRSSRLPWSVVRPGCVYGPYGKTFIVNPLKALARSELRLVNAESSPSNTVYVDNLVEAFYLQLKHPEQSAKLIFPLADDDGMTWGDFFDYFGEHMGARYLAVDKVESQEAEKGKSGMIRSTISIAGYPETKSLIRKIAWTHPIGKLSRSFIDRSPSVKTRLKRLMGLKLATTFEPSASGNGPNYIDILPRWAEVSSHEAREKLGWKPLLSRGECLLRTWEWAVNAQITSV